MFITALVPLVTEVLGPPAWCGIADSVNAAVTLGCLVASPTFSSVVSLPVL